MQEADAELQAKLLICGASVRAASQSAHRAGFQVLAADLFSDRDLAAVAKTFRIQEYPSAFAPLRAALRDVPVVYTGALENHPSLLEDFAREGVLLGNGAAVVRQVRDPIQLHRVLKANDIVAPEVQLHPPDANQNTRWLNKPLRSAGGSRVRDWQAGDSSLADSYYQQHIQGSVRAGSFLGGSDGCYLVGISDTYVGCDWTEAQDFAYCGSVVHHPDLGERQRWQEIGDVLTKEFRLKGLFGVDAIVSDGLVWPIEVNPRYTASMELFESDASLVGAHVRACRGEVVIEKNDAAVPFSDMHSETVGKAILYAPRELCVPDLDRLSRQRSDVWLADIPQPQTWIGAGRPIVSLLAAGNDKSEVELKLRAACGCLLDQLISHVS